MISRENEKQILIDDITNMKSGQFEQLKLVTFYSLSSYFKSLFAFGSKSNVTKDNLRVIKEMFNILRIERRLFDFILANIDKLNVDSVSDIVYTMDELNDKTVDYYYGVIKDIEDAASMKEERRGIRPKKNFETLDKDVSYATSVIALAEDKEKIKTFLNFEEEFWNFIKDKENTVDVPYEIAEKMVMVTTITTSDDIVDSLRLLVPKVNDLFTALLVIKCYVKAHNVYKMIGSKVDRNQENNYIEFQNQYKEHLEEKAIKLLNKKM